MPDTAPTPWNFPDDFPSPDNFHKLSYYDLTEVAMGAPLRGGQRIGVVNVITKELTIFHEPFSVLDLRSFDKNVIYGHGHPVKFDIQKKRIEKIINLVE
jgi:hypothetical protein